MKCLKCGTSITSDQVFCAPCLEDMERHPVKPGTPIVLPNRPERPVGKSSHKRIKKPDEQIKNLRSFIFWLLLVVVALIVALVITLNMLLSATGELPLLAENLFHTIL